MNKKNTITSLFIVIFLVSLGILLPKTLQSSYAVSTTFADTIMNLASTDACNAGGTGVCPTNSYTDTDGTTKYHDYRFRGADPNNYVSFNNDIYRVIGVFDSNSHGVEGKYLVKLIRSRILGGYSWGVYNTTNTSGTYKGYTNDWTGNTTGVKASANVLLNEFFYNKTDTSSTYGTCSSWTYYYDYNCKTFSCSDIVGHGIDSNLRDYIEEVTWYLKGYKTNLYSKQNFYLCERGLSTDTTNCMSANSGAYDASTTSKIGLMYASDYLYASSYYADAATNFASSSYNGNKNWLYKGEEWTITPEANSADRGFFATALGYMSTNVAYYSKNVRPTFYLKSTISIFGGSGTIDNPYTLG